MSNYVLLTPLFHPQSIDYFSDRLLVQLKDKDSWPVSILTSDWRTAIRMRLAEVLNQHRHLVKKCERCFERFVTANTEETFCSKCSDTIRKKEEEERGQMRTAQP